MKTQLYKLKMNFMISKINLKNIKVNLNKFQLIWIII